MKKHLLSVVAICAFAPTTMSAQPVTSERAAYELIEAHKDWRSITISGSPGETRCAIYARPLYSEVFTDGSVSFAERGERAAFVTWLSRATDRHAGSISFHTGITLNEEEAAQHLLIFDDRIGFRLHADGGQLYTQLRDNTDILSRMRSGRQMALQAQTEAGNTVKDTYSLLGVQAATQSMQRKCR